MNKLILKYDINKDDFYKYEDYIKHKKSFFSNFINQLTYNKKVLY